MSDNSVTKTAEFIGRLNSSRVLSGAINGVAQFTGKLNCDIILGGYAVKKIYISDEDDLIFVLTNNDEINLGRINGRDGIGITTATINDKSHLILKQSNGNEIDCGYIVSEETDPTVPDWAKGNKKPDYTPEEVGIESLSNSDLLNILV